MTISVRDLTKTFDGHRAIDAVSFDVPDKALFCVVGPSGCGKSTLLRLIAGLEMPDSGTICLNGAPVTGQNHFTPPEARQVGVVFQSYALWPHMTVAQNVAFPDESRGTRRARALQQAHAHLNTVALSDYADRRPEALSGGQRQRVALARCLAGNARTILMDEPLANLDPHLRATMEEELRRFHDATGVTTLFITHDQREAMALADVMAVMDAGRMLQIGAPQDIYHSPRTETVARFIGRGTVLDAIGTGDHAQVLGQTVPLATPHRGPCRLFVRPEQIGVATTGWPCRITSVQYRGSHWEALAQGDGAAEPIALTLAAPVRLNETLRLDLRGGCVVG